MTDTDRSAADDRDRSTARRRDVLRVAGAAATAGVVGLAGCSQAVSYHTPTVEEGPAGPADPVGPTATFRGGLRRQGFYPDRPAPVDPAVEWSHGINTGDHSAAKASAVPLSPGDLPALSARADGAGSVGESEDPPAGADADGGVVVPGDDGTLYALEPDGDPVWAAPLTDATRGMHGTPTVAGDTVYVGAYDGVLYALDRRTGRRRWAVDLGGAIGSSPVYHGGDVYIAVEFPDPDGSLYVVDARTGSVETEHRTPTDHPHSTCALAPDADRVVVGANDGGLYAWSLSEREHVWTVETGDAIKGPVAVHDGLAVAGSWDHHLYAVDLATGETRWRYRADDKVMSGPAVDPRRGVVYVGSHDSRLHAVDLDGEERWRYDTAGWIVGCPSVLGDRVVVGSYDGSLYGLTPDGEHDWSVLLDGWVTASPRVVDGRLYVADRANDDPGEVYALA